MAQDLKSVISGVKTKSKKLAGTGFAAFFSEIDWKLAEENCDNSTFTRIDHDCGLGIVYPVLLTDDDPVERLMAEAGQVYLETLGDTAKRRWLHKFETAMPSAVNEFQSRIESRSYSSYRELVDSIESPVTRLVAINLANALIANKTPISSAFNIDVRSWGPTTEYATGKRYHSLTPLWSAYCPDSIQQNFGLALAYTADERIKDVVSNSEFADHVLILIKELT